MNKYSNMDLVYVLRNKINAKFEKSFTSKCYRILVRKIKVDFVNSIELWRIAEWSFICIYFSSRTECSSFLD